MTAAMAIRDSDGKEESRNSDRDLLLGRAGRPGASRKPAPPSRRVSDPSGQADSALLRESLQRLDGLLERTAAAERSLREASATLERMVPAVDEFVRRSGELSRERAAAAAALSAVLSRLEGTDGKIPDAAEAAAPLGQDVARLEETIGELARTPDERGGEVANEVRLLGRMLTVRMDEVGRNLDGIRAAIGSAVPLDAAGRRISRKERELPPPVPAVAVRNPAGPDAMERAVGVLGDLHGRLGIGLQILQQALPQADRRRAVAEFRRSLRRSSRRSRLRQLPAAAALAVAAAWVEETWHPLGSLMAWIRFLAG